MFLKFMPQMFGKYPKTAKKDWRAQQQHDLLEFPKGFPLTRQRLQFQRCEKKSLRARGLTRPSAQTRVHTSTRPLTQAREEVASTLVEV